MANTATILGPYTQEQMNAKTQEQMNAKSAIQSAIVTAATGNTLVAAEPFEYRGSIYIIVSTS
jgi:hypothetical protein